MKFKTEEQDVWFTSDTHFGHKNIVTGTSEWSNLGGCRPFYTLEEHNNHIVDQINKHVMPNDILFHLGDWSFGGIDNIWKLRKRINCEKIYLCLGNHDHHIEADKMLAIPEEDSGNMFLRKKAGDYIGFGGIDGYYIEARHLFSDVNQLFNIKVNGQRITICHYSMNTWFYHNKGSWMLFGHSHGSLHPQGKTIDVGIDNYNRMFGEYRPFKFQELQKIMSKKDIYYPDHHNQKTNAK